MNILAHSKIYLCGQIEHDPNERDWRVSLAKSLYQIEPTLTIWDPLIKPNWVPLNTRNDVAFAWKNKIFREKCNEYQQTDLDEQDWKFKGGACLEANKQVRFHCKMLANKCDIIIARISKAFTWGSIDELEIAVGRNIPRFIWLPDGLVSIYGIAGCVDKLNTLEYYVHTTSAAMLNTIAMINNGTLDVATSDPEMWSYRTWPNTGTKT